MTSLVRRHHRYDGDVPGVPMLAMMISNSERGRAACPLRWWFGYGEGLVTSLDEPRLRYGGAWHQLLEDMHRWWMIRDEPYPSNGHRVCCWCVGNGQTVSVTCHECKGWATGPADRALQAWIKLEGDEKIEPGQAALDHQRLCRAWEGYTHTYGFGPLQKLKPIGVELRFGVPILNPSTSTVYRPSLWMIREGQTMRVARTSEANGPNAVQVRWPWYYAVTLDLLLVDREDPRELWLWEGKTAKSPTRRMHNLSLDPQVQGYSWAINHAVKAGLIEGVPRDARLAGYVFDVVSNSMQHDPKQLAPKKVKVPHPETGEPYKEKGRWVYEIGGDGQPIERSPGLSMSKQSAPPSWRFANELDRLGLDRGPYEDHMLDLMERVDTKLYQRNWSTCGPEVVDRFGHEVYGVARRLAEMRRSAATATTPYEIAQRFPRVPICTQPGGGCSFTGPCLQDGDLVRNNFKVRDPTRWVPASSIGQDDLIPT